jgi:Carboxypeptidase regulatory-like domain
VTPSTPVIAGVVRDGRGDPVDSARVYVVGAPVSLPDIAALTGSDGTFSIGVPVTGRYTVEATAEGSGSAHTTVDAQPGVNHIEIHLGG